MKPNSEMLNPEESLKKAKLFLCSRDIQVGDTVWSNFDGGVLAEGKYLRKEGCYMYFKNSQGEEIMLHEEECKNWFFKVIGEISPEATWIKEGDELDEHRLRWKPVNDKEFEWSILPRQTNEIKPYPEAVVEIMGSCGHFH